MKPLAIVVPIVAAAGVAGFVIFGMAKPSKQSEAKKLSNAASAYVEPPTPSPEARKGNSPNKPREIRSSTPAESAKGEATPPVPDPLAGERRLAKVWKEMDPSAVAGIVEDWKDEELALQLGVLPADQAASILAALKPKRASSVAKLIKKQAEQEAKQSPGKPAL
jgi:hypothetical protein